MTRVAILSKYGAEAASTRQRQLLYLPALEAAGFTFDFSPLLDDDYVRAIATGGRYPARKIAAAYAGRIKALRDASADMLWLYVEALPYMPAFVERFALDGTRPLIVDFDDAFFHQHERHWWLRDKMAPIFRRATVVVAGNAYLADYARRWNANVSVVPTVVDTDIFRPSPESRAKPPVVGWIGSPSTWAHVRPILPVLHDLVRTGRARLLVVGAGAQAEAERFEGMEVRPWTRDGEADDLAAIDIGIMPLDDTPWARGKCGYKLIQYMACGLPTIASPIGVNGDIVRDGVDGFHARDNTEWATALDRLAGDEALRRTMGARGRERAVEHYSLRHTAPIMVDLFRQARG